MPSINLRFRASRKSNNPQGRLFFRLIHNRETREICSDFKIYNHEWNAKENTFRFPLANAKRAKELEKIALELQEQENEIHKIIDKHSSLGHFTLKDIQASYDLAKHSNSFYHFVTHLSSTIKDTQQRTALAYLTTCKRAMDFNKGFDFSLEHINVSFVKSFEAHLKKELLKPNTISFYWYRRLGRRDISIFGKWKKDFIWEQIQLNFTDASRAMTIVMNIYQN